MVTEAADREAAKMIVNAWNCGDQYLANNLAARHRTASTAALTAENQRLREVIVPFLRHYEPWMDKHGDEVQVSTFSRHTFGELRAARAALSTPSEVSEPVADHIGGEGDMNADIKQLDEFFNQGKGIDQAWQRLRKQFRAALSTAEPDQVGAAFVEQPDAFRPMSDAHANFGVVFYGDSRTEVVPGSERSVPTSQELFERMRAAAIEMNQQSLSGALHIFVADGNCADEDLEYCLEQKNITDSERDFCTRMREQFTEEQRCGIYALTYCSDVQNVSSPSAD